MRILLIGSGGREHALAWRISQSHRLTKLYCAPGNGGTASLGETVALGDNGAVVAFARAEKIGLVIVGPEAPLVSGLADDLRAAGIQVFGPGKAAAQLEGSKAFTKALCDRFGIPTAAYRRFDAPDAALAYLSDHALPVVIKADGLAAGKGVTVATSLAEAEAALLSTIADGPVVIEDFLEGEEVSVFAVVQGDGSFVLLPSAQDHKRAFDGDVGPNTGGMGAYSPAPVLTPELETRVRDEIIVPTLRGMEELGSPFRGVLFAGLMLTADGPKLIEYNVRFGDPECQTLMMRLKSDVIDLLQGDPQPRFSRDVAVTVVVASKGYPGTPQGEAEIHLPADANSPSVKVFHAGTRLDEGRLMPAGGRVLNVTALGATVEEARDRAYQAIAAIDWPDGFYRRDIGWRAVNRSD